jgi:hypothetical protein
MVADLEFRPSELDDAGGFVAAVPQRSAISPAADVTAPADEPVSSRIAHAFATRIATTGARSSAAGGADRRRGRPGTRQRGHLRLARGRQHRCARRRRQHRTAGRLTAPSSHRTTKSDVTESLKALMLAYLVVSRTMGIVRPLASARLRYSA